MVDFFGFRKQVKKMVMQKVSVKLPLEQFLDALETTNQLSFHSLAEQLDWPLETVEKIALALEKRGVVAVQYPALGAQDPLVLLRSKLGEKPSEKIVGQELEEYSFLADGVPAKIKICRVPLEARPRYYLLMPEIGSHTKIFLEELKEEIAQQVPLGATEGSEEKMEELKNRFWKIAQQKLQSLFPHASTETQSILAGWLLHSMYGLGILEGLLADQNLEEIAVNSSKSPVVIYHRKHGWLKTNLWVETEEQIYDYGSQIARKIGRELTVLHPILDAHLVSGDRATCTLHPITSFGNTLTIRRFARKPWTIADFIGKSHTMNIEMAALLWTAIQFEMNIIIAGGTASGKTSVLNVLSAFIPNYHRVISIEDVREIMLPQHLHFNWVPMSTRNPNPEGRGEISMLSLLQASLRMRPDRMIVGEIRRKAEAEVLFEAMHTGHSVYSTVHANNAQEVLHRLLEEPIGIPAIEIEDIDLVVVQYRDRRLNIRRTFEIAEFESGARDQETQINTVFKWQPREDSWETVNPATKFVRNMNAHTGLTEEEIEKELIERGQILEWMLEQNLDGIDQVGQVMNLFYAEPETIRKAVQNKTAAKKVLGVERY